MTTTFANLLSAVAVASLAATPVALQAQASAVAPTANPLGLPETVQLLGQTNPNNRRATARVNGDVITGTDVDHRVALVTAANGNASALSGDALRQLQMQVLRNLIDETLQIQAAEAQEMPITQGEIDRQYQRVAAQNFGTEINKMDEYLTGIGSSVASLKRQIEGELAWSRLLRRNVQPFINVSEEEVEDMMTRMEASRGTAEYRLGEIYLSATDETAAAVEQNGVRIMEQLRDGGSFVAYARQFSEASTAAVGGDLGFVRLGQLPPALATVAQEMQPGQLVGPIRVPGGFSLLYLIDKKQVLTADPRDAILSLKQIAIDFPEGVSQDAANSRVTAFGEMVNSIRGCGDAERAAATVNADVVTNDQIRVRSLPEALQSTLLELQVGQSTPPFGSVEDGVRVLLLCGRDDPESTSGPSRDEMMAQLTEDRVGKRAQRFLRDLRNDAYIQYN
ncbi:peptidylprolyl isomerase [Qipengyuania sp. DSG2-2]|uniref:peptidylprolyl isomerase n=1 Tax=Qipengyuania sp. DGS2-2 TaxID=3349631 RepID=UPI0036D218BE